MGLRANKDGEDNDPLDEDHTALNESDEDNDYLIRAVLFANIIIFSLLDSDWLKSVPINP